MLEPWQSLLSSHTTAGETLGDPSATVDQERQQALRGTVVAPFTDTALYTISGADATGFLQGQLTCDVSEVDATHSRLGAWCSAKGRVQTTMRLLAEPYARADDQVSGYGVLLAADHAASMMQQLQRFVFRAKVAIEPLADRLSFGLSGAAAVAWIDAHFGAVPSEVNAVIADANQCVVRLPAVVTPRFLITAPMQSIAPLWHSANRSFPVVGSKTWRMLDILADLITVDATLSNQYLPQMINLDRYHGISYTKGCYIGQEIVARTHHLGRLKRRAFRVRVDAAVPPIHGDNVYMTDPDPNQTNPVGSIIQSQALPDNTSIAHAILRIDQAHSPTLRLGSATGAIVSVDEPTPSPTDGNLKKPQSDGDLLA